VLIRKGDQVRLKSGGPSMEVLAAGSSLAICEWQDDAAARVEIFELGELVATPTQQVQQPQPTPAPPA